MNDHDDIDSQLAILIMHRRRLAYSLRQQARLGDYAPPRVALEIEDAHDAITTLKRQLRDRGVAVEDQPEDVEAGEQPPSDPLPPLDLPDLFPPAQALIGRQDQYARIIAAYDRLAADRRGRFVFLTGRPGHGRRALAHALADGVRVAGGLTLHIRF